MASVCEETVCSERSELQTLLEDVKKREAAVEKRECELKALDDELDVNTAGLNAKISEVCAFQRQCEMNTADMNAKVEEIWACEDAQKRKWSRGVDRIGAGNWGSLSRHAMGNLLRYSAVFYTLLKLTMSNPS